MRQEVEDIIKEASDDELRDLGIQLLTDYSGVEAANRCNNAHMFDASMNELRVHLLELIMKLT